MFTTTNKIRRAIPVLVASLSVAVAAGPVVPYAQARPNDGRFHKAGKPTRKDINDGCQSLKEDSSYNSDKAADAYASGNAALGKQYSQNADADYEAAKDQGCRWAQ